MVREGSTGSLQTWAPVLALLLFSCLNLGNSGHLKASESPSINGQCLKGTKCNSDTAWCL